MDNAKGDNNMFKVGDEVTGNGKCEYFPDPEVTYIIEKIEKIDGIYVLYLKGYSGYHEAKYFDFA